MNAKKRRVLVDLIRTTSRNAPEGAVTVVPLEAFFDGNDDQASLGCNIDPHPGIARFHEILGQIRRRDDVQDVVVGIFEVDDDDVWPFSEAVYVLTSARAADVKKWVKELRPDEVTEGELFNEVVGMPTIEAGNRIVQLWWD